MTNLHQLQVNAGATLGDIADLSVPLTFGNDPVAVAAAQQQVAVCDRCHWGRIEISGADRIRYLQNQSTNDFNSLQPGAGCDTVFVTSTARTLDLVTAYVLEDRVLLLVSPNRRQALLAWLDRYIFPADRVVIQDRTLTMATFSLIGPQSDRLLAALGGDPLLGAAPGTHCCQILANLKVRVAVGSGLALPGYTLCLDTSDAAALWQALTTAGAVPLGEQGWEQLRIQQGRPAPDRELTEEYNPLEAGLWHAVSFSKGCYIGQETIARLQTYKGVKQQLWGIRLQQPVEPGSVIRVGEEKVGKLTSVTATPTGLVGLAYIRTKAGGENLSVDVGDSSGQLVDVPFLSRELPGQN
ncbi:glycine cleavage system protein T [Neosynechococcus sphagnicola sy1]|uniref:Glycine cleavage system protein T n=1 Tax=Neosynechococcus sphagnicola sy1 TaxID=1497020 RepID=A0A098TSH5_9CYAN|nr:folate-binding protein YgfZ [Neosynechococcus sphagnicola]KGF73728.1 glycine cleavage system protein T [Neosynechococcus sphagnicola sy1]